MFLSSTSGLSQVGDGRGEAFNLVVRKANVAGLNPQPDPCSGERLPRLSQGVPGDGDRLRLSLDVDGNAGVGAAVHNAVVLQAVAVRGERLPPLRPEQHADLAAP